MGTEVPVVVSYGDVVVRGPVTDWAWRKARASGVLRPIKPLFEYGRDKYLAAHVEEVFGLPSGSVGGVPQGESTAKCIPSAGYAKLSNPKPGSDG